MSSGKEAPAVNGKDSTINLLRLFKVQPNHHVVTRHDLTRDYKSPSSFQHAEDVTINNYYTWNSSSTNAPIHKYVTAECTNVYRYNPSSVCWGLLNPHAIRFYAILLVIKLDQTFKIVLKSVPKIVIFLYNIIIFL